MRICDRPPFLVQSKDRNGAIVLKNSKIGPDEKARQIESQRHIAVRHYLSPAADLARFGNAKSAGPPANLLNAVSVGLP